MGPNADGVRNVRPFRHADHIRAEELNAALSLEELRQGKGSCATCHGTMFDAPAGFLAEGEEDAHPLFDLDQNSCRECHIADAQRNPVVFKIEDVPEPSQVAGTFSHASHLGVSLESPTAGRTSTAEGLERIMGEGCFACHTYDEAGKSTYTLKPDMASFAGCQTCHVGTAPWSPPEPQSAATWWTPRDHSAGKWEACQSCHDFTQADFKANRPVSSVRRRLSTLFRIEDQMHPHITTKPGEATAESCKDCHRRPVAKLPSRIQQAAFRHGTHLSGEPSAEECASCHGSRVQGAPDSDSIAATILSETGVLMDLRGSGVSDEARDRLLGLTYDPAACAQCHLGTEPLRSDDAEGPAAAAPVLVPEFPHAQHLAPGSALTCIDCHSVDMQDGGAVQTLPAASDCSSCHNHNEFALQTGQGISATEVASCKTCHVHDIPAIGVQHLVPNTRITDIANGTSQYHPPIGEVSCGTCHVEWGVDLATTASRGRVRARRTFYAGSQRPSIHRNNTRKRERAKCTWCHWTAAFADAGGSAGGTPDPNDSDIRALIGDNLSDFPGGK